MSHTKKTKTQIEYKNLIDQHISVKNLPYKFIEFNIDELNEWKGIHSIIKMECIIHGFFNISINNLKNGKGCNKCGIEKVSKSNTMTPEVFLARAFKKHNDFYSYENMNFNKASENIKVACPKHGDFSVMPSKHLSGTGCPKCAKIKRFQKQEKVVIEKIKTIHGTHFSFEKFIYNGSHAHSVMICNTTGMEYKTTPHTLLQGHGCKFCNGQFSYDTPTFIKKAKEIHGDKYNYEQTSYSGLNVPVCIYCNTHEELFYIKPSNHIHGRSGCQKCARYGYQPMRPGFFYIQKLTSPDKIIYKYGITCDIGRRVIEQSKNSIFEHEVIVEIYFDDGSKPLLLEKILKNQIDSGVVNSKELPSGFTETFTEEHLETVLNIVNNFK